MSEITFGTDGWRAIIADKFTFDNVQKVAHAVGLYIRRNYYQSSGGAALPASDTAKDSLLPVLIGYDTRFLADRFAEHAARTLITMGIPAKIACRDVPTPAIAWAAALVPTAGALQLTASHNPPEYCGMKYIPHFGGPATNEITAQIAGYLLDMPADFHARLVDVPVFDPQPPYLEALKSRVDLPLIARSGLKVAFDANYSTSRDYLDKILLDAGCEVKVLHNWADPLFGGNMPEPKPEYLKDLLRLMAGGLYDVGLATDGDADRFGVVDETGTYFSPNQLLALVTRHLVKNRGQKGSIVRTVATTHLLNRLAELYGLSVLETPVGFKYIGEHMRSADVLLGGEESGGISVKGHIPEKDGILGNLLLVEMIACEGKPLSRIWTDLQVESGLNLAYRRADLSLSLKMQRDLMGVLAAKPFTEIGGQKVTRLDRLDGLKFYFDEFNWLLVRPSGTEPLMRLYFEGTSSQAVEVVMADFKQLVLDIVLRLNGNSTAVLPQVLEQGKKSR